MPGAAVVRWTTGNTGEASRPQIRVRRGARAARYPSEPRATQRKAALPIRSRDGVVPSGGGVAEARW